MNDHRKPKSRDHWTTEHDAALTHLAAVAQRVKHSDTPDTRAELFDAVEAARIAGVGWTKIGDTLGIASGNAYQRYRKRPQPGGTLHGRATHEHTAHTCGAGEPPC